MFSWIMSIATGAPLEYIAIVSDDNRSCKSGTTNTDMALCYPTLRTLDVPHVRLLSHQFIEIVEHCRQMEYMSFLLETGSYSRFQTLVRPDHEFAILPSFFDLCFQPTFRQLWSSGLPCFFVHSYRTSAPLDAFSLFSGSESIRGIACTVALIRSVITPHAPFPTLRLHGRSRPHADSDVLEVRTCAWLRAQGNTGLAVSQGIGHAAQQPCARHAWLTGGQGLRAASGHYASACSNAQVPKNGRLLLGTRRWAEMEMERGRAPR
ncbi:hypothetical protein FA95DRAFT_168419 [Auriscalpium vulgare]|uniref:Uncharacterized protein n=1 Tax=Auriscalpium vulgare TaxID=40419 RepID=A0ACB8RNF6_9AGAM|nr:hypothetical protein FA95DRAFT_168419 [Auriscalpium vulgare]